MPVMNVVLYAVFVVILAARTAEVQAFDVSDNWTACNAEQPSLCMKASVPDTVLTNLLRNQSLFSPITLETIYVDDNLSKIPDIAVTGKAFYTYWFHNEIEILPSNIGTGSLILKLHGCNYRCRVEINGTHVLPLSSDGSSTTTDADAVGMFSSFEYDVTKFAAAGTATRKTKTLLLSILVEPPDWPGDASSGGQGGDHLLAKNGPIAQFAAGWDWAQATPDRMTGLWDRVELQLRPTIDLKSPFVQLRFPKPFIPGEPVSSAPVEATVSVTARVPALQAVQITSVRADLVDSSGKVVSTVHTTVNLPASEQSELVSIFFPVVSLNSVNLWWPSSHGQQHLYSWHFYVDDGNGNKDAETPNLSVTYGFRQAEMFIHKGTQGWACRVNGQEIFLQGGNYITTDQLLQFANDVVRYENEVRMYVDAGMNLIRVWGGGIAERSLFYEACDRLGLLVYQEFWMTGDNNGRWGGDYSYPANDSIYISNARSTIVRLRTHPSLLLYCMGNELLPDGVNPKPAIVEGLTATFQELDPQRFFIQSSMSTQSTKPTDFDASYALSPQDGPYSPLFLFQFYSQRNPGLQGYENTPMSFQPEVGSVSTPEMESFQRFLTKPHLEAFPNNRSTSVDPMWEYHKYEAYNALVPTPTSDGDATFDFIYEKWGSAPTSTAMWVDRANLVQYEQYRGLFEGFQAHMFEWYGVVLMWKSSSPWPALRGFLYDYYLRQTGGFYGVKKALKGSLHVQMDALDDKLQEGSNSSSTGSNRSVRVINKSAARVDGMSVIVTCYSSTGVEVNSVTRTGISLSGNTVLRYDTDLSLGTASPSPHDLFFTDLELFDQTGTLLSSNVYWENHQDLAKLPLVSPTEHMSLRAEYRSDGRIDLEIHSKPQDQKNSAKNPAVFMLIVSLVKGGGTNRLSPRNHATDEQGEDHRILPTFYSDNYLTLFSGQKVTVTVSCHHMTPSELRDAGAALLVKAWNMEEIVVDIA